MKVKILIVMMFVVVILISGCGSFEKIAIGKYENDIKDSWVILNDDSTFTARINYNTTGGPLAMRYHGTYTQKRSNTQGRFSCIKLS